MSPSPTAEERRRWWLICYCVAAMRNTQKAAALMFELCDSNDHPLFYHLAVALHTCYARPFQSNKVVKKLVPDFIPPERLPIHRFLIHFRDKTFSHLDADHDVVAQSTLNTLVYFGPPEDRQFSTSLPLPQLCEYEKVYEHCGFVGRACIAELQTFHSRFADHLPASAEPHEFALGDSLPVFNPCSGPVEATFDYSVR